MNYLDRIIADRNVDEQAWMDARPNIIGASNAASFAKAESAHLYAAAMLRDNFKGNAWTASGNIWESRMLAHFGLQPSGLLVADADEPGFAATPDAIEVLPSGEIVLVECKAIHNKVITGPTPAFRRQMWWAQMVFGPEVRRTKFIWQDIVDGAPMRLEPHIQIIERNDDEIAKLRPIGVDVLARIRAARQFAKELNAA